MAKLWSNQLQLDPQSVIINILEMRGLVDSSVEVKQTDAWNDANDQELIQTVKIFKPLYAKSSNSYKVLQMKENCWQIIGPIFGVKRKY